MDRTEPISECRPVGLRGDHEVECVWQRNPNPGCPSIRAFVLARIKPMPTKVRGDNYVTLRMNRLQPQRTPVGGWMFVLSINHHNDDELRE
jgi:hypothetical protein